MKRLFDIFVSFFDLLAASPITVPAMIAIWLQDRHSPFYSSHRVGRGETSFRMVKLRSMITGADKSGVDSTSQDDQRITWIGKLIRKYKLDELSQLWNVLIGHMSLVGPRPNVKRETDIYTKEEKRLLDIRPGVTDLASIVFADEGEILEGAEDPDLKYNQVIRPWKSRLGLLYVDNMGFFLDLRIIILTAIAIVSRETALRKVSGILNGLNADPDLIEVAKREKTLKRSPPPGASSIVQNRDAPPE